MPSVRTPRACSQRRRAPVTTARTTSLTVPPSAALIRLNWARSARTHSNRRCEPTGTLSGTLGRRVGEVPADLAQRLDRLGDLAQRRPAGARPRARPGAAAAAGCAATPSASLASSWAADGVGLGTQSWSGSAGSGTGLTSKSTVAMSTPGDAVDERVVGLGDEGEALAGQPLDHPQLPERLRAVELLGEHPRRHVAQLLLRARRGQRRVADVVLEVEGRVVDPERAPGRRPAG